MCLCPLYTVSQLEGVEIENKFAKMIKISKQFDKTDTISQKDTIFTKFNQFEEQKTSSKNDSIIRKALFFMWLIKVLLKYTYIVCSGLYAYAAIIIYLVHSNLSMSMDRGCQFSFSANLAIFALRVRSAFRGMKSEEGDQSNKNGVGGKREGFMVSIVVQTWEQ